MTPQLPVKIQPCLNSAFDSALTEIPGVKLLEDVLVVEVLEHGDGLVQLVVDLALGDALLRLLQQHVAVTGQLRVQARK